MDTYNVLCEKTGKIVNMTRREIDRLDLGEYIETMYSLDYQRKYVSYQNYLIQVILDENIVTALVNWTATEVGF